MFSLLLSWNWCVGSVFSSACRISWLRPQRCSTWDWTPWTPPASTGNPSAPLIGRQSDERRRRTVSLCSASDSSTGFLITWATSSSAGAGTTGGWGPSVEALRLIGWLISKMWDLFGLKVRLSGPGSGDAQAQVRQRGSGEKHEVRKQEAVLCFETITGAVELKPCSVPLRLSYHQRIVDIVPPTFSALIPAEPIFTFKYEDESAGKEAFKLFLGVFSL